MTRVALAIIVTAAAGVVTAVTHHHPQSRRLVLVQSAAPVPVIPAAVRARATSRGERRRPLPRAVPRPRGTVLARGDGRLADTTMYCSTGNRNAAGRWPKLGDVAVLDRSIPFGTRVLIAGNTYYVEDWIGWGSDFDIYGGNDAGCEQRALNYGRRHLRVVVG